MGFDLDLCFYLSVHLSICCVFLGQHMYVLMEHIDRRYGPALQLNRGMFVSPWFTAHVQGKA